MSKFFDTVKEDTPRLVVMYQRGPDGSELFQWGIVGNIPILTLIGAVVRVQTELAADAYHAECDQPALVIVWDAKEYEVHCFLHQDIPTEPLVGMLETIKAALVGSRLAQHLAAQRILGPDGSAVRR